MNNHVQQAFGLNRPPFDKDIPPELLWMDESRRSAVERLTAEVAQRRHALVLGEPGVGKTCVLRALREQLSPVHFRIDYIVHVTLQPRDFYRQLCFALGVETKATPAAMFEAIQREYAVAATEQRQHAVVVLDEAHLMPDTTLGHLHLLANFTWDREPLLSLVLVGLPELLGRLRLGIHRSLLTRIHAKVELEPASPELTAQYVRQRLEAAGAKREVFTRDGLSTLHELTGGLLRSIDILALAALRLAAEKDQSLIDREIVLHARRFTPLA